MKAKTLFLPQYLTAKDCYISIVYKRLSDIKEVIPYPLEVAFTFLQPVSNV
ncbi:MAG: hypothetical protein AAF329_10755 [Cyanobacteria bacterium P01_A01_bin.17]